MEQGMKCWVFDMDGTLADSSGRAHHLEGKKNWDAWYAELGNDPLNEDVAAFADLAKLLGIGVVICTGRGREYEDLTREWLEKYDIQYNDLYMRPARDYRDDTVIKRELLAQMRSVGWEPLLVFEDRSRVVKMWREEGIRCFQVAEGDF
jgi:phosphoglycolate phosphatase-like HAD superfamily hydrolase